MSSFWDADQQKWVSRPPDGAAPPPDTAYDPADEPPSGASRASVLAGALAGVVLAGGIGTGIWALVHNSDDDKGGSTNLVTPSSSPWPSPSPSGTYGGTSGGYTYNPYPTPTSGIFGSSATSDPGARPGFVRTADPSGYRLDVPTGWLRSRQKTSVFYTSPGGARLLQVFPFDPQRATPYDSLAESETYISGYSGYRKSSLSHVVGPGDPAELEYTYVQPDSTTRYVVMRAYRAPDGNQYALLSAGPDSDRSAVRSVYRALVDSFCPTGHCTT
ncbi:hypothetical protein [Streptomyces sp. NPDC049585]|uniref:hypothetical protein n=1 Tax=Streptomyces sp. NPDC049585 TaxID=3155154 RepID=UPI00343EB374